MGMLILPWSKDYELGIKEIDEQHLELFKMINLFAFKANITVTTQDMLLFLDKLLEFAERHFHYEEEELQKVGYPLVVHHATIHRDLKIKAHELKKQILFDTAIDPKKSLLDFVASWLKEHIAETDMYSFHFHNENSLVQKANEFIGKKCEIYDISNHLLCKGTINKVNELQIIIDKDSDVPVPIKLEQQIKVQIGVTVETMQLFLGRVSLNTPDFIQLFGGKLLQIGYSRQYIRIPTEIGAILYYDDTTTPVSLIDLSVGGLMLSTDLELDKESVFQVSLSLLRKQITMTCSIKRISPKKGTTISYGCQFIHPEEWQTELIAEFLFLRQKEVRSRIR